MSLFVSVELMLLRLSASQKAVKRQCLVALVTHDVSLLACATWKTQYTLQVFSGAWRLSITVVAHSASSVQVFIAIAFIRMPVIGEDMFFLPLADWYWSPSSIQIHVLGIFGETSRY
jgi:hypothetical protein